MGGDEGEWVGVGEWEDGGKCAHIRPAKRLLECDLDWGMEGGGVESEGCGPPRRMD